MRKLALAISTAVALTFAGAAQAEINISPTTTVMTSPVVESAGGTALSFGFSDSGLASSFNEVLTFTNSLAGTYAFHVGNSVSEANGPNDVDFTSVVLTGTGIGADGITIPATSIGDLIENRDLTGLNLGAGTYTLNIIGNSGTSGSLGGTLAFLSGSAVPEPGTWAMMLVGFGAVGYGMRRQRRSSTRLLQAA